MSIFKRFYPNLYTRTTYNIDFIKLFDHGFRGIIFDIDNTLVPHDAPADIKAAMLFRKLQAMGFQTMIVSNNKEPRVKSFADVVGSGYVFLADKPGTKGYLEAVDRMGLRKEQVIVIGDQFFTDIWGANRSGLRSVMVGRISSKEPPHIHLKRMLEQPIKKAYFKTRRKSGKVGETAWDDMRVEE